MKILVSGADGFTGKHFINAAQLSGHETISLQADLTDTDALEVEVNEAKPEAVVHLAAISFIGHDHELDFYSVNVIGTINLLNALTKMKHKAKAVLLASSANVYGNCLNSPISETEPPAPVNHYAASKLAMEHIAKTYSAVLPLLITRPFNYTGVGQSDSFLIPKIISHFVKKEKSISLGNINVCREFNDVRFVCNAYLELLKHSSMNETYNICSGNAYPLVDVINTLQGITGHKINVKVNPAFVRKNEIKNLRGNPDKLNTAIDVSNYTLKSTLQWMLEAKKST